jgi:hypothetical protein
VLGMCPLGPLVVMQRQWRRSVTRMAAWRAEREALDRRRAGASCGCVRAGAHAYLGPRPWVWLLAGDMMVMGCGSRWGECGAAARSLQAVHADVAAAGSREPAACIG